jgi:hypothetical protein
MQEHLAFILRALFHTRTILHTVQALLMTTLCIGCCLRLQWLKNAPLGEFIAHRDIAPFVLPFCEFNHTFNEWCMQQMNGMFYGPSVNVPTADFILISRTWPSTVASRNLEHWAQVT